MRERGGSGENASDLKKCSQGDLVMKVVLDGGGVNGYSREIHILDLISMRGGKER